MECWRDKWSLGLHGAEESPSYPTLHSLALSEILSFSVTFPCTYPDLYCPSLLFSLPFLPSHLHCTHSHIVQEETKIKTMISN